MGRTSDCRVEGAILTRVRVPGATRDCLPESAFSADSLTVSVQPPCAIACINICAHVKKKEKKKALAAIPLFGHPKMLHTLTGIGSAALAAAVPYPGKATRNSYEGQ